jgi:hypothetical protein
VSNCTGVVYGVVRYSDGSPIPGATVDINWIQESQGGPLRIGGDDNLTIYTPQVTTTKAGEYVVPVLWGPPKFQVRLRRHWRSVGAREIPKRLPLPPTYRGSWELVWI